MSSERVFLIAPVDAVLIAEPTVESRPIADAEFRDVAQLVLDSYTGAPGQQRSLDQSLDEVTRLMAGETGTPRRDCSRAIWFASGTPISAIVCTTWRGMPYIAQLVTAPTSRQQGYASSLVREFASTVRSEGGTHLGLMLKDDNLAMGLFRELGFVEMFTPAGL